MEESIGNITKEYKEAEPVYSVFTRKVESLVQELLDNAAIQIHSVTSRVKKIDSLSDKLTRNPGKYEKLADVTDLSGVRVTCWFLDQISLVEKVIKDNFDIDSKLSVDKREEMDPDKFGYVSIHYIISLSPARKELGEFKNYADLRCEVQIRTILQHAWAEIEHDLGYKSKIEIPKKIKRQFYRLAGLFELADDEFQRLRIDTENYKVVVERKIESLDKDIPIDKVSYVTYLESSEIVKNLDGIIVGYFGSPVELTTPTVSVEDNLKILSFFNISTIKELEENLVKNSVGLTALAEKWIDKDSGYKSAPKGISIFYLGYLLAGRTKNEQTIMEYLKIFSFESHKEVVAKLTRISEKQL